MGWRAEAGATQGGHSRMFCCCCQRPPFPSCSARACDPGSHAYLRGRSAPTKHTHTQSAAGAAWTLAGAARLPSVTHSHESPRLSAAPGVEWYHRMPYLPPISQPGGPSPSRLASSEHCRCPTSPNPSPACLALLKGAPTQALAPASHQQHGPRQVSWSQASGLVVIGLGPQRHVPQRQGQPSFCRPSP